MPLEKVRKRDGRVVEFDPNRISAAIRKAYKSIGGDNKAVVQRLVLRVQSSASESFSLGSIPGVEDIQDIVERVLMEDGHAKIAKAYILYREKRGAERTEKKRILEKDDLDEVDKVLDVNALRVLKSRYLRKRDGRLIETPRELFERVAITVGLPDLLYDHEIYSKGGGQEAKESYLPDENAEFRIGRYELNRSHIGSLKRMYDRHHNAGSMKVTWSKFLQMLKVGKFDAYDHHITNYYDLMISKRFMPNTPALANFGTPLGMGSACFVLGIDDSIESIMETLKQTAIIFKAGGGVGYNFSKLRPEGDFVSTTSGIASGPLSFMRLFDTMTEVIKQGGIRRGANMGILDIDHPDIEKFVTAKKKNTSLKNFNLSVLIKPDFWDAYKNNRPYPLVNPRTKQVVREINPRSLFDLIVYQAWESAEPGLIFFDHINDSNPFLETLGPVVTTNPCGEVLLYPNESCNLGSVNVWQFVASEDSTQESPSVDWESMAQTVRLVTRFLDNIIDVSRLPLVEIEKTTHATRKIGVGVMGVADLLFELKLPYDSASGRKFMSRLIEFINYNTKLESIELARTRGSFPLFQKSSYSSGKLPIRGFGDKREWHQDWDKVVEGIRKYGLRNGYTTVIAPTGSISMIAGCSAGMEPIYSLAFEKNVNVGTFYYVDPVFARVFSERGFGVDDLSNELMRDGGSIRDRTDIPEDLRSVFVTALDISPRDHLKALAAFQMWTDSSISKTNNFPADATLDDMRESFLLAHELGCKDVTVFRDSSISDQVLVAKRRDESTVTGEIGNSVREEISNPVPILVADSMGAKAITSLEDNSICPTCASKLRYQEGCATCPNCGWEACQ